MIPLIDSEVSTEMAEMTIRDLDDYLVLLPDGLRPTGGHQLEAQEIRDSLSGRLRQRLSGLV